MSIPPSISSKPLSSDLGITSSMPQGSQPVFGHHSQGTPPEEKKLKRNYGGFSGNKSKLFIGGLVLSLFMVAGGVAFHLSQQEGVGEIRQQASVGDEGWILLSARVTPYDTYQLFAVLENGGEYIKLVDDSDHSYMNPSYSSDGNKILYSSNFTGDWRVYLMNADGTNNEELTSATDGEISPDVSPALSSDMIQLAFVSSINSGQIKLKSLNGGSSYVIASYEGSIKTLFFSPNGNKLFFSSTVYPDEPVQLFSFDLVSNELEQLTDINQHASGIYSPFLVSANEIIYFSADESGVNQIFKFNLASNTSEQWTYDDLDRFSGTNSPDGTSIAYIAKLVDEELKENTAPAIPTNTPIPPTTTPIPPTLTPIPSATATPSFSEKELLECSNKDCENLSSPICINKLGVNAVCARQSLKDDCEWFCVDDGEVMGVTTTGFDLFIENIVTGELFQLDLNSTMCQLFDCVIDENTQISPNAWSVLGEAESSEEPVCFANGDCSDNNECTNDVCNNPGEVSANCVSQNAIDGIECTGGGTCESGICVIYGDPDDPGDIIIPENETHINLIISLDGVPYCEKVGVDCVNDDGCTNNQVCVSGECNNCYHPPVTHSAFLPGGNRSIPIIAVFQHAQSGLFEPEFATEFRYSEDLRAFVNNNPIVFEDMPSGPYIAIIKGPMHLATRYCHIGAGIFNNCTDDSLVAANNLYPQVLQPHFIYLNQAMINNLDLSARPVKAGDLPHSGEADDEQDALVNIYDYSFMLSCLSSTSDYCLSRASLRFSGRINNIDLGYLRRTMLEVMDEL